MYVLNPDVGEEQLAQDIERFNEWIVREGGSIDKIEKWGRRKLAYEIDKKTDGFYVLIRFTGEGTIANEISRLLRIQDDVIRSMAVRLDA